MRIIILLIATLALTTFQAAANEDSYSKAAYKGPVDLSYACPSGSKWHSRNGGECLACDKGWTRVDQQCKKKFGKLVEVAKYVYTRKIGKDCRKGTFSTGLTRRCYENCPSGFETLKKLRSCVKEPKVEFRPANVVAKVSPRQLIDPATIARERNEIGCESFGEDAFFDLTKGGSCWTCPASHPIRTTSAVNSDSACATPSCGAAGERPCLLWERPLMACNRGLIQDPLENICVPRNRAVCESTLSVVNELNDLIEQAEATGEAIEEAALENIKGLKAAVRFVENQTAHLNKALSTVTDQMPLDQMISDLNEMFPTPQAFDDLRKIAHRIQTREEEFKKALLNPEIVCSGNLDPLEDLFRDIVQEASLAPSGKRRFAMTDVLGIAPAHAASSRSPLEGWTISYSYVPTIISRVSGAPMPIHFFGLQASATFNHEGHLTNLTFYRSDGVDLAYYPAPQLGETMSSDHLVSFTWPDQKNLCDFRDKGLGLILGGKVGLGVGCNGLGSLSFNIKNSDLSGSLFPDDLMKKLAEEGFQIKDPTKKRARSTFSFGMNIGVLVAANDDDNPSRYTFAQ